MQQPNLDSNHQSIEQYMEYIQPMISHQVRSQLQSQSSTLAPLLQSRLVVKKSGIRNPTRENVQETKPLCSTSQKTRSRVFRFDANPKNIHWKPDNQQQSPFNRYQQDYEYKNVDIVYQRIKRDPQVTQDVKTTQEFMLQCISPKPADNYDTLKNLDHVLKRIVYKSGDVSHREAPCYLNRNSRVQSRRSNTVRSHQKHPVVFDKKLMNRDTQESSSSLNIQNKDTNSRDQPRMNQSYQINRPKKKKEQEIRNKSQPTELNEILQIKEYVAQQCVASQQQWFWVNKQKELGYAPRINKLQNVSVMEISFRDFMARKIRPKKFKFSSISNRDWSQQ